MELLTPLFNLNCIVYCVLVLCLKHGLLQIYEINAVMMLILIMSHRVVCFKSVDINKMNLMWQLTDLKSSSA